MRGTAILLPLCFVAAARPILERTGPRRVACSRRFQIGGRMRSCLAALTAPLLLVATLRAAETGDAEARYLELCKQFNAAQTSFVGALYKSKNRAMEREAQTLNPNVKEFSEQFLDVAHANPRSDTALKAIFWILTYSLGGREAE